MLCSMMTAILSKGVRVMSGKEDQAITIAVSADTSTLVKQIKTITKHLDTLADKLAEIDKEIEE